MIDMKSIIDDIPLWIQLCIHQKKKILSHPPYIQSLRTQGRTPLNVIRPILMLQRAVGRRTYMIPSEKEL